MKVGRKKGIPMTTDEGLLQAIFDSPEDDLVRLVYADWLEEHGSSPGSIARAEFIRLQVDQAPGTEGPYLNSIHLASAVERTLDPVRTGRIIHLETTFYREWLGSLAEEFITGQCTGMAGHSGWLRFLRGFPEELHTDHNPKGIALFLRWADELARISPLRKLDIDFTERAAWPSDGPGSLDLPMVQALAGCPLLARLHTLELAHGILDAAGIEALVGSPHLTGLRQLTLKGNHLTAEGVRALLEPGRLPNLITLEFSGFDYNGGGYDHPLPAFSERPGVDREGVRVLASSPLPPRLQVLILQSWSNPYLGDAELFAFTASPHLERLTTLDFSGIYGISPEAREALRQRFGARVKLYDPQY